MRSDEAEADRLRATEHERLRALVDADLETAEPLHAEEFTLVNPAGGVLSKREYLDVVASGEVDYLEWEPAEIDVRLHGDLAVMRYQAEIEIVVAGRRLPRGRYWHMDCYERLEGRWQVVWSQATQIE